MASPKQISWVRSLAAKKQIDFPDRPDIREYVDAVLNTEGYLENATNDQINEVIGLLEKLPWLPREASSTTEQSVASQVEPARYFIIDPIDGKEKFIKVDKPDENSRWHGYTFVSVQASDDFYPVRDSKHREAILQAIVDYTGGPVASMNEYGIRLSVCGKCGRTLTDRDSRLRGLGPICAAKVLGAPTPEQLEILRRLGLKD